MEKENIADIKNFIDLRISDINMYLKVLEFCASHVKKDEENTKNLMRDSIAQIKTSLAELKEFSRNLKYPYNLN